jgi:cardiolipin synthase
MNTTVMRGVSVEIVIPERPNLRAVGWAATGQLWQILEHGCRLWLAQEPFDHTKLMIVDDVWSLIGSANWDPRSLRLNFEFDVECYDADLATRLNELFVLKREHAREATIAEVDARPLPIRLRDGVARLFSPYL